MRLPREARVWVTVYDRLYGHYQFNNIRLCNRVYLIVPMLVSISGFQNRRTSQVSISVHPTQIYLY